MRLPIEARVTLMAFVVGQGPVNTTPPPDTLVVAPGPATYTLDRPAIKRAVEHLKSDPNLVTERSTQTLHWADRKHPRPKQVIGPKFEAWVLHLFDWLARSARFLVWVTAACMVGLLAIFLLRVTRIRLPGRKAAPLPMPTHVQDLDIRPESLPADIGKAARELWDSGQTRMSLSLLYRGLLSRLVHVHQVPIRDSSTEGDCLHLAGKCLADDKRVYVTNIIAVWQRAVYGAQPPSSAAVHELCMAFGPALDAA